MKNINTTLSIISIVILCTLLSFVGCSDMMATLGNISLTIDLDTPEVEVASYTLEGNLVDTATRFTLNNITPPRHTLTELKQGRWNLSVKAFDDQGSQIGIGTKAVDLKEGQIVDTSLLVVFSQSTPLASAFTITGPSRHDSREGSVAGTTVKMEYRLASAAEDAPFSACSAGITLLIPGTYKVRYAAAHGLQASECLTVTVPAYTPIQLTITSTSLTTTKEYDGTNTVQGSITPGTLSGMLSGDEVTVHTQAVYDSSSVGNSKTITVTYFLGGADANNYLKPVDAAVTGIIQQKQLSITGTSVDTSKEYDNATRAEVSNLGSLVGVIGSEQVSVTASAVYRDKNAGTGKQITVTYALTGDDKDNYLKPVDDASFAGTITRKALTANLPSIQLSKEYDGTTAVFTTSGSLDEDDVIPGDDVQIHAQASYNSATAGDEKTITVTYNLRGDDANNYTLLADSSNSSLPGVISKRRLTATVGNHTKIYGQANPSFTVNVTGFVNGETASTAGDYVAPIASTAATTTTDTGNYEISISGGSATNYSFNTSDTGTLTINKATYDMSAVSFTDKTVTYNGTEQSLPISGTLPSGVTVSYTDNAKTDAGTYTATAHFSGDATNYEAIADKTATLTINKAVLTATVGDYSKTYGTANPVFTVSVTGFVNGETALTAGDYVAPTASTAATTTTDTGNYEISISGGSATNYSFNTSDTGTLIIEPITMTGSVILTGSWTYGETLTAVPTLTNAGPAPTYIWVRNGGLIAGATESTYTLTEADIGYSIKVAINATAGNYKGQVVSTAANISKAAGASFSGTISAYYPYSPATKTIVNVTGFDVNQTGLEANISTDGTTYGSYDELEIDSRGRAMISTTSATKVKIRYKETPTAFPGADLVLNVAEQDLAIGDYYAGGVVGYIYQTYDPGYVEGQLHGLIAAKSDTSTNGSKWSTNTTLTIGTGIGIGTGSSNTDAIILALGGSEIGMYGAKEARLYTNGDYNDWFLPSWHELLKLRDNRVVIGNFVASVYMSSSESTQPGWDPWPYFHAVYFDGDMRNHVFDKPAVTPIRAVRYF
ncbi:YDG domain-containing protein [Sphaerochaeta globosa]|uniref:DUF1566 domain-containing protein n=1 Tax=Sphaerochaeta globosa (strain ATCC BAA-1886 / DSM 22777 / Buddy) TaxID=158189 RepID=F0RRQ2_SPHGB|nr:YDG domain-containing protein [Sphaerochaeta globosa]ADY14311.1 hypothetical protein SpiBuddy_2498 [Sphaerochaeta globosa str. Buddy]